MRRSIEFMVHLQHKSQLFKTFTAEEAQHTPKAQDTKDDCFDSILKRDTLGQG